MKRTTSRRNISLAIAVVLVSAACGGGEDTSAIDSGSTQATTSTEGSVATTDDGATVEASDGDTSASIGGGDIPADVPVPLPDGGSVGSVLEDPSEALLNMRFDGDRVEEFTEFYQEWFDANGIDVNRTDTEVFTLFTWQVGDQGGYVVSVAVDPTGGVTGVQLGWPRTG